MSTLYVHGKDDLRRSIDIGLDVFPVLDPVVQRHGRAEVTQHRRTEVPGRVELAGQVDGSPVELLPRARLLELLFLEGSEYGLVCPEQHVSLLDVSMHDVAFFVQKVQGLEEALEHKGHNRLGQSPHGIAMPDAKNALPERWVHETPMPPLGPVDDKRVEQRADSTAARVVFGGAPNALVHVELIIQLTPHGLGTEEQIESDVPTLAGNDG